MASTMVFRKTNGQFGRHVSVTPQNSTNVHLSYGRIILNQMKKEVAFRNPGQETGLLVLSGSATITAGGQRADLNQYDAIYVPPDEEIAVSAMTSVDIAEFSAPVSEQHTVQVVRYQDVAGDGTLKFTSGTAAQQRVVNIVLGKNVQANRLLIGFTVSDPGNWTSWPPHEHAKMLEEMYVYFDMPDPAFGIQLVYNDTQYPEFVTIVRDGDAVLIPSGYHPNVSVPGHRITFLWALAAHREKEDRQWGVVNIQPEFRK
jgi:5-deoxy-glucuronate isomerase